MAAVFATLESFLDKIKSKVSIEDFLLLWLRVWVAKIFYDSGRTKAGDGFLEINDFQGMLFEEEYGLSFVNPELLAQMALYAETFLPLALFFGLVTRFSALGLLGMTIFIQVFVYPGHFFEHATWAIALFAVSVYGAGSLSLDRLFFKNKTPD